MTVEELEASLAKANDHINALQNRVHNLEIASRNPLGVPETKLLSYSFLERAFAVLGHNMVASLIISIPFYILLFILMFAVGDFR